MGRARGMRFDATVEHDATTSSAEQMNSSTRAPTSSPATWKYPVVTYSPPPTVWPRKPPQHVYTKIHRGVYAVPDDLVVRWWPDPSATAEADADLGFRHYKESYAHHLTAHNDLVLVRSGMVDVVAHALMRAFPALATHVATLEMARSTLLWTPTRRDPPIFQSLEKFMERQQPGLASHVWRWYVMTMPSVASTARKADSGISLAQQTLGHDDGSEDAAALALCQQCHAFGCTAHGDPVSAPATNRHRPDAALSGSDLPCSATCCKTAPTFAPPLPDLSADQIALIRDSLATGLTPCDVAALIPVPCRAIADHDAAAVAPGPASDDAPRRASLTLRRASTPPRRASSPPFSSARSAHWAPVDRGPGAKKKTMTMVFAGGEVDPLLPRSRQFVEPAHLPLHRPCSHPGEPCTLATCTCLESNHFCDVHCGCAADCPNRWPGCDCVDFHDESTCKDSVECLCVQWARECGPACACPCRSCKNREIGKGVDHDKKLNVAVSTVPDAGWGLFAQCDFKADDFLGEYSGEVLSSDEADRRGIIYDRKSLNYCFQLATDAVVDAYRLGPVLRFCNHAAKSNVNARVAFVDGSQRIGFYAKKNIKAGDELFLDYGRMYWGDESGAPSAAASSSSSRSSPSSPVAAGSRRKKARK
ncbi:Histone-lysine N-methyltransferase ezh1 [Allomyces javanicus]|nr:Histone-lysine N-methyltransferase ezh1 [Allomyces javanicus]